MNARYSPDLQQDGRQTEKTHRVTFLPANRTVITQEGVPLLDVALKNGIDLEHNCGGNCACSTCHVIILQGMEHLTPKQAEEQDQLEDADGPTPSSRLACQAKVFGDVTVEVPQS